MFDFVIDHFSNLKIQYNTASCSRYQLTNKTSTTDKSRLNRNIAEKVSKI